MKSFIPCAVCHLAESGSIGVVGDSHGYAVECLAHVLGQRNLRAPGQVRRILDLTGVIVAVRRTDTDSLNLILQFVYFDKAAQTFVQLGYIIVEIGVLLGLD